MGVLKLQIQDLDVADYDLIAIHTSLEDYRLAYLINQKLPIVLSRNKTDLGVISTFGEVLFTQFTFLDATSEINWHLVQNKNEVTTNNTNNDHTLFFDKEIETVVKVYLLSDYKKVDYFLKIENNCEQTDINYIIKMLLSIAEITTAYRVNPDNIKSKNNLIF